MLQWDHVKSKARHDKHCIPHSFEIGDQVWLHLKNKCFTSPNRKMKPLRYGLHTILKHIWENTFQLNIPSFLGLHLVFNVDLLWPYHAPLLEHNDLQTTEPEDIHPDVQKPLPCNTIVGWRICHTRMNTIPLFQVAKARQIPVQGKWYSATKLTNKFPHLNEKTMGTTIS